MSVILAPEPAPRAPLGARLRQALRTEVVPGTIGSLAVVAVPLSLGLLAYAPLGAASTQHALSAAAVATVLGGLLYAWLGRAALPAAGCSSATTLILAALVLELAADPAVFDPGGQGAWRVVAACGAAVALSGLVQVALARAGLARLARQVPRPVLGGFMNGVALLILAGQVPLLLGVPVDQPLMQAAAAMRPGAALLGVGTVAAILLLERWRPGWPAMLLVLAVGTLVHVAARRTGAGDALGPAVGPVSALWPDPVALLRAWGGDGVDRLLPHAESVLTTALVLGLIGGLESLLGLLALDEQLGTRHDPRHELQAIGLCNLACGLLGSLPVVLLRARAVAIRRAGGGSALAAGAGAGVMALLFFGATPVLGLLPFPVLGGVMVAIAFSLVDRWAGSLLVRWGRGDDSAELRAGLAVMLAVCALTLWKGFAAGVALGVLLSMVVFIARMNRSLLRSAYTAAERPSRRYYPASVEQHLAPLRSGVCIWELEGTLFFGNADRLSSRLDSWAPDARALVLDLRRVRSIDETGLSALARLADNLQRRGVWVQLSGVAGGSDVDRTLRAFRLQLPRQPDVDRATEAAEAHLLGDTATSTMRGVPLAGCELLQGLSAAHKQLVMACMPLQRLVPDEVLFRQGDAADGLYVVTHGSISLVSRQGAQSQRFLSVSPGMMLGEAALLDGGQRSADAVADGAAVVHKLSTDDLNRLLQEHPAIAAQLQRNMAVHLSRRLRAATATWWSDAA